jgi:hypothetical protein
MQLAALRLFIKNDIEFRENEVSKANQDKMVALVEKMVESET